MEKIESVSQEVAVTGGQLKQVYTCTCTSRAHDKTGGGRACNFHSLLYVRAEYLLQIDTSGRERVRYLEILSHEQGADTPIDAVVSAVTGVTMRSQGHRCF